MNKWKGFEWTKECAQAFQQLKEYLSHPPIMSSLETNEVLFAYIAVAPHVVSLVLIRVDSGRQRPVYYVTKSLNKTKIRYLPLEKAILAVVHGTRKLPQLLPSTHGSCPNPASTQSHTSKCWLHWEDSKVGHDLGHFWHQIHALYLNQRLDPCRFGRRVHWGPCRRWIKGTPRGWKISWPSYGAKTIAVEGIRGWGSELKRVWHGASLDLT